MLYAGAGTAITYVIGRRLVSLKYNQERFEANFRFGMARIRENSEQIALLGGEKAERAALGERYDSILANVYGVVRLQLNLTFFSQFFGLFSSVFPFLLLGPAFFFGHRDLRRADEGGGHLRPRAGRPHLVRRLVPAPRQLPRHRAAPRVLRGGDGPQRTPPRP